MHPPSEAFMTRLKLLLFVILAASIGVSAVAESAEHNFKVGVKAEQHNNYDAAFQAYKRAHELKTNDPKYMSAFLRMRFYAAAEHIHKGQGLRDEGKLDEAMAEFRLASTIDPANFQGLGEMARTNEMIRRQEQEKENLQKNHGQPSTIEKEAASAA